MYVGWLNVSWYIYLTYRYFFQVFILRHEPEVQSLDVLVCALNSEEKCSCLRPKFRGKCSEKHQITPL